MPQADDGREEREDRPHRCVFRRLCERLVNEYEMDELGDMDAVVEEARKALGETP